MAMTIKEMAKLGGRASVLSRFGGKTKKEISEQMRKVRLQGIKNKGKREDTKALIQYLKDCEQLA